MKKHQWKKLSAIFLAAACLLSAVRPIPAKADEPPAADVTVTEAATAISIGNAYISRTFSMADRKLCTANITNKRTAGSHTIFMPADGSEEFKIRVTSDAASPTPANQREFAASQLTFAGYVIENTQATINRVQKTGKKITFSFAPFSFRNTTYTIKEIIVMYDGDHFMRKYLEISVPENQRSTAAIDYIDLESLVTNASDATWTIPTNAGGIVQMESFKANLGQPIYIQGMFFGCEFPAADNEIAGSSKTGYVRYYTGKSFERMRLDNQLTPDGTYVTWQTVAGAARSTENEVIQADFFEYIKSIATPSEFRIQYNSWFDNMMLIDDANIKNSFIEIDRELNKAEVRPLDSYVVDDGWNNYNDTTVRDALRSGTTLNTTGFWAFNSKFPNELRPSSELVHKFGSNFGVWIGPRGGYNYYNSLADLMVKKGTGSKAGNSIDVADRTYVKNFQEMAIKWMKQYKVNYWKWDGFIDIAQYGAFSEADGIPGYANRHMTGGYKRMYHVTDCWEAWIDLMEAVRQCEQDEGINKLWISLTCYVNPSPWYLQWANSVWIQCTHDQNDAGSSQSKMDRQMTYRDACYYDFLKNHQFQFPLSNIYNHDPVYGKEGTGMNINTATDAQFANYLYMISTRGTAFWELYFSDSIMTDGKYEAAGAFLEWAEKNHHILKNAKMFGASPNTGTVLGDSSNGTNNTYGYACFDGTNGILSLRNPSTAAKTITFTFDRTIGVPEDAGSLKYHIEHSYNMPAGTDVTGTLTYGQSYTYTLQPDEVRILQISKNGDTKKPEILRAYNEGANTVAVKFSEKVKAGTFKINQTQVSHTAAADGLTFRLTMPGQKPEAGNVITVTAENITDLAGNALAANEISFRYYPQNLMKNFEGSVTKETAMAGKAESLTGNNGFTVKAEIATGSTGQILAQGRQYALGILDDGKAYFSLNGATAKSGTAVNNGRLHTITGVKENNGMLKLYIDGQLEGSSYKQENRYYEIAEDDITVGSRNYYGYVNASVSTLASGYNEVRIESGDSTPSGLQNWASGKTVTAKWAADGSDASNNSERPVSMVTDGIKNNTNNYGEFGSDNSGASSYIQIDFGEVRPVSEIHLYRYWNDNRTYGGTVVALSETENFDSASRTIVYNSDTNNFHGLGAGTDALYAESSAGKTISLEQPVQARYLRVYMHGRTGSNTNHVVEVEALGQLPPVIDERAIGFAKAAAQALLADKQANPDDYTPESDFNAVQQAYDTVVAQGTSGGQEAINERAAALFLAISAVQRVAPPEPEPEPTPDPDPNPNPNPNPTPTPNPDQTTPQPGQTQNPGQTPGSQQPSANPKPDETTETVTSIAPYAFTGGKMTAFTVEDTIETIGKNAFANCRQMKSLVIGKNVKSIASGAFKKCTKLKTITFKGTSAKIAKGAFSGVSANKVIVPKQLKKNKAFLAMLKKSGLKTKKIK